MSPTDPKDPAMIARMAADPETQALARKLFLKSCEWRYSYNFSWLGVPIIQYPQDLVATQEIVWKVKPDLIVETGVAHGGSLIFYASLLQMIGQPARVVGIDVDIRAPNRAVIEAHPMFKWIALIQGSSVDSRTVAQVKELARDARRVLVSLDSNHTHEHVLKELQLYSPLVTKGSYLLVFDTVVDDMPRELLGDRPWDAGNSPKTAVREFLRSTDRFEMDREAEGKLLLTVAPEGFLRCIKDPQSVS